MPKRPIDTISQESLVRELKPAIDAVRIADPIRGVNPAARRRLRRLISENPTSVRSFKVLYNIGQERSEWLQPLIDAELGNGHTAPRRARSRSRYQPMRDGIDYDSSEQ